MAPGHRRDGVRTFADTAANGEVAAIPVVCATPIEREVRSTKRKFILTLLAPDLVISSLPHSVTSATWASNRSIASRGQGPTLALWIRSDKNPLMMR